MQRSATLSQVKYCQVVLEMLRASFNAGCRICDLEYDTTKGVGDGRRFVLVFSCRYGAAEVGRVVLEYGYLLTLLEWNTQARNLDGAGIRKVHTRKTRRE